MATYLTLWKWTEQGAKNARATPDRAQAFKTEAGRHGVKVVEFMWTQGQWDGFALCEAPDEQTIMAVLLDLIGAGNVTTQTCRAFSEKEMREILQKAR
jgi:uncharacterized protein with GYD domain